MDLVTALCPNSLQLPLPLLPRLSVTAIPVVPLLMLNAAGISAAAEATSAEPGLITAGKPTGVNRNGANALKQPRRILAVMEGNRDKIGHKIESVIDGIGKGLYGHSGMGPKSFVYFYRRARSYLNSEVVHSWRVMGVPAV